MIDTDNLKILIVDDDKKLCNLIADYLEPFGYTIDQAHDGYEGYHAIQENEYNAVILDVMMPKMDGLELLRKIREFSAIPVLMLTARGDEIDRIIGLEMGADDYLPKTFSSRELLARLRAVTRRHAVSAPPTSQKKIQFANLVIEIDSRSVLLSGKDIPLTPVEFDLLVSLAESSNRVLSRDQLLQGVSGRDYEVFDRSIDVHISSLRKKLGDDPKKPKYIRTIRSAGYMFTTENGSS